MRNCLKMGMLATFIAALPSAASAQGSMQMRAAELTLTYLEGWSSDHRTTLAHVKQVYAPRVRFYGRTLNHSGLYSEKRRVAERWPVRTYEFNPGTGRVLCAAHSSKCTVTGLLRWKAENPNRRAVSQGLARFSQTFDFSTGRPVVVAENGRSSNPCGKVVAAAYEIVRGLTPIQRLAPPSLPVHTKVAPIKRRLWRSGPRARAWVRRRGQAAQPPLQHSRR